MVSTVNPNIAKTLKEIVTGEIIYDKGVKAVTVTLTHKPEFFCIFFVYIFIHISANMSPFGNEIDSQMILPHRNK